MSETSLIYITVYDRAQEGEGFLGIREIRPVCRNGFVMDSWFKSVHTPSSCVDAPPVCELGS